MVTWYITKRVLLLLYVLRHTYVILPTVSILQYGTNLIQSNGPNRETRSLSTVHTVTGKDYPPTVLPPNRDAILSSYFGGCLGVASQPCHGEWVSEMRMTGDGPGDGGRETTSMGLWDGERETTSVVVWDGMGRQPRCACCCCSETWDQDLEKTATPDYFEEQADWWREG